MAKYTPMIEQYLKIKEAYPNAFLFFRLGDFYELFFEDATLASQELEITLTGRAGGGEERIPMCGVPYHSSMHYIRKLIDKGYKVAICEQVEDPKDAKGVVKREVIRVITPGTLMEESMLPDRENNYILFLHQDNEKQGLVACDVSTGEVTATETNSLEQLLDECLPYRASEIVLSDSFSTEQMEKVESYIRASVTPSSITTDQQQDWPPVLFEQYAYEKCSTTVLMTLSMMLSYLSVTQKRSMGHLQPLHYYQASTYLKLDAYSRRNLELTETIRNHEKKGSLLWLLDETATAMGGRLLKKWIQRPLTNETQIEQRLHVVEVLIEHMMQREEVLEKLKEVYDLERLTARVSYGNANPRDLLQLKKSLHSIPQILETLAQLPMTYIHDLIQLIDPCSDLADLLETAIAEDAPMTLKEGGIFKQGYHQELDRLLEASRNGKQWIAELEQKEKSRTGIKSLKVGYNKVFGYYIEVTKANLHLLPKEGYERKQTLANAERYITPELKEKEALILEAEERLIDLEHDLFLQLRNHVMTYMSRLQHLADSIAQIDVLCSFAKVSEQYHYVRPRFTEHDLEIIEGRHPVVEKVQGESSFVSNDIIMDQQQRQVLLITGPNMAGKSTYMRQTALMAIMAQMGCFVPAQQATLPIFDQIFTRIGAADDLVGGQSTFMVEMMETKRAITQATAKSLILLDEIGRGTSTYDGMSLAQAVVEYIHDHVQAKTLFSTHYHELTELENHLKRLTNIHVACTEQDGKVVFLHKVKEGKADRSYGIHVAQLADMPNQVIDRANQILQQLEAGANEPLASSHLGVTMDGEISAPEKAVQALDQESACHAQNEIASTLDGATASQAITPAQAPDGAIGTAQHTRTIHAEQTPIDDQSPVSKESEERTASKKKMLDDQGTMEQIQFSFFDEDQQVCIERIEQLNLVTMTPLEALNTLFELQERLKEKKR